MVIRRVPRSQCTKPLLKVDYQISRARFIREAHVEQAFLRIVGEGVERSLVQLNRTGRLG